MTFLFQWQGADGSCRADLTACIAARCAASPVGHDVWRPQAFQSLLEPQRLQHVAGTRLKTLTAANAHLQEFSFGHAAGRSDGARPVAVQIRSERLCSRGRDQSVQNSRCGPRRRRQKPASPKCCFVARWIVFHLQTRHFPTVHELDRMSRTDAAARLAESAVGRPSRKVWLDRVEWADLNAFVAVDAR